jgi:hypothetical protein
MERMIEVYQCSKTKECANNQCFWRQRDIFGRSPWLHSEGQEKIQHDLLVEHLDASYGPVIFPKLEIGTGTNCIHIFCPDFKEPSKIVTLS